jgi:hypothetical protein
MLNDTDDGDKGLLPLALFGCVGALGLAFSVAQPTAAIVVAQLIAGIAINRASDHIPALLKSIGTTGHQEPNHDLERVAKHAVLTILYETLQSHGWDKSSLETIVRDASSRWDVSVFPTHELT